MKSFKYFLIAILSFVSLGAFAQIEGIKPPTPKSHKEFQKKDKKTTVNVKNNGKKTSAKTNTSTPTPPPVAKSTPSKPKRPTSGWMSGYEWIDLDLPSGTLWATMNVGSESPEDMGYYYGWQETSAFDPNGTDFGTIENTGNGDAASLYWGEYWETPSIDQFAELKRCCKWKWEYLGNMPGMRVTGKNGNSIFFPAAGALLNDGPFKIGYQGAYWSSTERDSWSDSDGQVMGFDDRKSYLDWEYTNCGLSIRPVLAVELDFGD